MRFLLLFMISLAVIACNRDSKSSADAIDTLDSASRIRLNDTSGLFHITCWGVGEIELSDNYSIVELKVGKENISQDSLFLEGTFERIITTLWKGQPEEIIINWFEKEPPFKTIKYLELSNENSKYHFENGIRIGSRLKDIEQLNTKSINLYGFGWDYGGTFIDFGKGKLQNDMPCFGGVFNVEAGAPESLMGDKPFNSSDPAFKNHKTVLKVIRVKNTDLD